MHGEARFQMRKNSNLQKMYSKKKNVNLKPKKVHHLVLCFYGAVFES